MSYKVRSIVMAEGKYLNLPDMKRSLSDGRLVHEKLMAVMKVGHDKRESAEQIVAVTVGASPCLNGPEHLAAFREQQPKSPFDGAVAEPTPEQQREILTQNDLNKMTCHCGAPDCDGVLFFHSKCHPKAESIVSYRKDGLLMINCAECKSLVCLIAVDRKA